MKYYILIALLSSVEGSTSSETDYGTQLRGRSLKKTNPPPNLPPSLLGKYNSLPLKAQEQVNQIFSETDMDPGVDGEYLQIDDTGAVYYEELALNEPPPALAESAALEEAPVLVAPVYHSRPSATKTLYLDFDGHDFSNHAWAGGASISAKPFTRDTDMTTYSDSELNEIKLIWEIVSEDFAVFDVDVTTEEPAVLDSTVGHVLITDKVCKNGVTIYNCGCGGVAYVNIFGKIGLTTSGKPVYEYYSPALVFHNSLGTNPKNVAEAASHEFGHNLGLSHDGGDGVSYYTGHGSGETKWAPIMGVGYYSSIVQWSKGDYVGANQFQDDLAIIANKLGYLPDDHTGTTPLTMEGSTGTASGIIEQNTDTDVFTFQGGGTDVRIFIDTENNPNYGNLDAGFDLVNADTQEVIAPVKPTDVRDAEWIGDLANGSYEIRVYGTGNNETDLTVGYTDYGSLGHYTISVTNLSTLTPPPTPSPTPLLTPSPTPLITQSPNPSCGDGICDNDESCESCPSDCPKIRVTAVCGNGICEGGDSEDCISCPQDCSGVTSGNPNNRYCCGDNLTQCGNLRCGSCTMDRVTEFKDICPAKEDCNDGIDNDGNGYVDCADSACADACSASCFGSGELSGECYGNEAQCCAGECHQKFNRCK